MHHYNHTMNTTNPIQSTAITLAIAILLFIAPSTSASQPKSTQPHIAATLESSRDPAPGTQFILALTLDIDQTWHTYWPGINDTGYGISLTFAPVAGLTFGDPLFPTPTRHIAPGDILDHIYENQITIYIPVEADESFTSGDTLTINTTIDYLICKQICIPESTTASITLAVVGPSTAIETQSQILTAYNNRPALLKHTKITWIFSSDPDDPEPGVLLQIKNATHYQFFPDSNCTNLGNLIAQGDTKTEYLRLDFDRRYEDDLTIPAVLSGRLRVKILDTWQEFDVHYTQQTQTETSP